MKASTKVLLANCAAVVIYGFVISASCKRIETQKETEKALLVKQKCQLYDKYGTPKPDKCKYAEAENGERNE